MRKRLFIAIQYLEIGGAERSLIGLLNAIDYTCYEVDLFVYDHRGEFMSLIPKAVRLLPENKAYAAINRPIKEIVKEGHIGVALARIVSKIQYAIYKKKHHPKEDSGIFQYVADCVTPLLPSLKRYGTYDLAISFLTPHNIVRDKVDAKQKIAWIHTDYSTISIHASKELPVWSSFDRIMAVSEGVKKTFLQTFPTLATKVEVMENILSPTFVREQADMMDVSAEMPSIEGELRFCSVGRFTLAKNFDNVPFICQKLVEKGLKFKWYILGYGGDEELIKRNIRQAGMEEVCILLGKQSNPYPFMKACDIYIQPSRFEGKAVTVREAQILRKPVVITRFATSSAQLTENVDGIIVPMDNEGAAEGIYAFAQNRALQQQLISYLKFHDYGNESEIKKLEFHPS
ncbi:MAG: glycosyltransferase [Bacteroidaceae bacterium]|nr:glycosyltransferase [Bacteroidaceae bacterium]